MTMDRVYEEMGRRLDGGERFALAVICVSDGSTPRKVGSKMLVAEDGSIFATIGGGAPEAAVIDAGVEALATGVSRVLQYDFGDDDVTVADSICGGSGSVAVCAIDASHKPVIDALLAAAGDKRESQFALHIIDGGCDLFCVDVDSQEMVMSDGATAPDKLAAELTRQFHDTDTFDADGDEIWFNERVRVEGCLYLIGGGHVSLAVEAVARVAGFTVVVIDDREEYSNPKRFPRSRCYVMPEYTDLPTLKITEDDYLAIVTRGHSFDRECLAWALGTSAGYIGMIGSQRKCDLIYAKLLEEGFSQEKIDAVHGPIGLPIGGNTPGEIAISIVAQLVVERAERAALSR